jgi:predicted nucleotidyltransferase
MNRQTALDLLTAHKAHLQHQFGVRSLALFGSTARGTAGEGSDVDVLVSFSGPASSEQYFGAQFYLEDLLKCPVDLVTDKALRKELRPYVERDAVHV